MTSIISYCAPDAVLGVKQEELVPIVQMRKFTFKGVMSHIEGRGEHVSYC